MPAATQQFIDIAGIKDGVIILRNGGYRIILSVSATNFALKSDQEQSSLIFQYQSFLNSLHFPIQILMRSKRLDLSPYLKKMNDLVSKQDNELLKMQTIDYVDFVSRLIELANIMKKTFYVVVPYDPITIKKASMLDKLFNREKSVVAEMRISEDEFKKNSDQLRQRAQVVASGLGSMGLRSTQLVTEEIIEVFYQIYNPEVAGKEQFSNAEDLAAPVVAHVSEKKEEADQEKANAAAEANEQVIDNSAEVASWQKEQSMQKQQEMSKEGERQIGMTAEATPKVPSSSKEAVAESTESTQATPEAANDNPATVE